MKKMKDAEAYWLGRSPRQCEIMRAVQRGLDKLDVESGVSDREWTVAVKDRLCEVSSCCCVTNADYGEWLYDITWLEYERGGLRDWPASALIDVHLVAECEWGNFERICEDFEKLLLARAEVRLMIFDSTHAGNSSEEIAGQLAERVRKFNGSRDEDAWLLAGWENDNWSFKYFTIGPNGVIPFPPSSGD